MENTRWWFWDEEDETKKEEEEDGISPTAELESVRAWEHEYLNKQQEKETKKEERL